MATFGWRRERSVKEWLFAEGYRFDFFQTVRLLEMLSPDSQPVGEGSQPEKEAVRFHSRAGLDFPASDVQQILSPARCEEPVAVTVNFLGLAGAHGPLPVPFTELILERNSAKDTGLADFLDIFNHRLVSLMYRSRKVHRLAFTTKSPEESATARYLYSFLGLGLPALRDRMEVKDRALLYAAGLLSKHPRSAIGLERLLSDHFQVSVKLRQLQGCWRELEPDQQTFLGLTGQNQMLGGSAVLGTRVWDQQGRFEAELGALSLAQFLSFLPGGSAYRPLCEATRFYVGQELQFSFRLKIKAHDVQVSRLGSARLGWTSWLKTRPFRNDDSQVQLSPSCALPAGVLSQAA